MGTGVLSLPATMAALGYTLGIIAIVTFAVAVYYSGFLLAKVRNRYYKHVLSYGDVAYVIHGTWFERVARYLLWLNWYSLLAYYITALTQAFQAAFWWTTDTMCFWTYCLVSVACLLPFIQIRTFHGISWFSLASSLAIVAAVVLFSVSYFIGDTREAAGFEAPTVAPKQQTMMSAWNAFSSIIFAFQGQSCFLEMMGEQKEPRQFPKSLALSQTIMTGVYLFTPLVAYSYVGQNVENFSVSSMPKNALRIATGVLIIYHILVAYLVTGVPLYTRIREFFSPKTLYAKGLKPALIHLAVTFGVISTGFVIANLIPYFQDMQNIISCFCGAPIIFFFPSYFYWKAAQRAGDWPKVPFYEKAWIYFSIFVMTPWCCGFGTYSAFTDVVNDYLGGAITPFACSGSV